MADNIRTQACIDKLTLQPPDLTGSNVIVAVLDSGIDYFLPDFLDENGETRLIGILDQTLGVFYSKSMINEALTLGFPKGLSIVPTTDTTGHGTAVAALAAGTTTGIAKGADILVVKLGKSLNDSFPRTTQLMKGIDYAVKLGISMGKPVAINVSFGNTYGDHKGNSLLERFIDNASEAGKTSIIIGSGNEGASGGHTSGIALTEQDVEIAVSSYETGLSLQIWKYYQDIFEISLISPGREFFLISGGDILKTGTVRQRLENTDILCYIGAPQPYNVEQEIFVDFIPVSDFIDGGVWTIRITPVSVVTGDYRMYLSGYATRSSETAFLKPSPEMTITIPSTSRKAISVGAYDAARKSYADFSGRGYVYGYGNSRDKLVAEVKPDIVAPGVDITVPMPYGGYENVSGTSFATPIVTGVCALMMEWGIIRGNDRYLYGERLKAALISGAQPVGGGAMPNSLVGWGSLCAYQTFKNIEKQ